MYDTKEIKGEKLGLKSWDWSVRLEQLANVTETTNFPLKFLLGCFLGAC